MVVNNERPYLQKLSTTMSNQFMGKSSLNDPYKTTLKNRAAAGSESKFYYWTLFILFSLF